MTERWRRIGKENWKEELDGQSIRIILDWKSQMELNSSYNKKWKNYIQNGNKT
jgi:hypothetical protein